MAAEAGRPTFGSEHLVERHFQVTRSRDPGVELSNRACGRVARIGKRWPHFMLELAIQPVEGGNGDKCLTPHGEQPRRRLAAFAQTKRNGANRSRVGRHAFSAYAIAAGGCTCTVEDPVYPDDLER